MTCSAATCWLCHKLAHDQKLTEYRDILQPTAQAEPDGLGYLSPAAFERRFYKKRLAA
jgi:hypothetical protein